MKQRIFAIALAVAGIGSANAEVFLKDDMLTVDAFPAAAEALKQQMDNGVYSRLDNAAQAKIEQSLDEIGELLVSDSPSAGSEIRREQIRINELLAPAIATNNKSEVVCRRVKPVGSNIARTECHDRKALEEHARSVQDELIRNEEFRKGGP